MIQLKNISLSYGDQDIFKDISCIFNEQQHIGVVGRNGAGKSTLLKAIAGAINLDEGSIALERGKKIAFMPQEIVLLSEQSVFDEAYSAFAGVIDVEKEKDQLEQLLLAEQHEAVPLDDVVERYALVQEQLAQHDTIAYKNQTEKILKGLGFTHESFSKKVSELSVGWKMRIVLAKLLLLRADFYLFDEPTNHLDIVSKEWFFDFLKNTRAGFLLVTHDRYYLEQACDYIFALERGIGRLYVGNFGAYIACKEHEAAARQAAYVQQQKEISRKQATIERFRASATKARMAQSMIKQLDKIELIEPEPTFPSATFKFPASPRACSVVLNFNDLACSFNGRRVFEKISGRIQREEKVALVAPNGMGKTTLFKLLAGKYPLTHGSVLFGHTVSYAIFEQDQVAALSMTNTVLEEVVGACPQVDQITMRKFLGSFLFSGDDVHKKIEVLSGGERGRVALVKLLLQKANFLLLDEPTNHLDIYAKEVLLQALQQYDGTLMIVSHDHDFIQRLATRIVELTPTALYSYPGTYESYLAQKKHSEDIQAHTTQAAQASTQAPSSSRIDHKESQALRKELTSLEKKITRLEKKIQEIHELFTHCAYGTPAYTDAVTQLSATQKDLDTALEQWEALERARKYS